MSGGGGFRFDAFWPSPLRLVAMTRRAVLDEEMPALALDVRQVAFALFGANRVEQRIAGRLSAERVRMPTEDAGAAR